MSTSEGYILNAIQTPGPMLPVYKSISGGNTTADEIMEDIDIGEGSLNATLSGLRLLRLIGREDGEYYTADFEWQTDSFSSAFRMTALHNLTRECTEGDWGKQAAALLNYRYLLENNIQYFTNNDQVLYDAIDDWYTGIGYEPMSQNGVIEHNDEKFANWTRLVHFLGLVYKAQGREHTVYPDPELIANSVEFAAADDGTTVDGASYIGIEAYLGWLRENLLSVSLTSGGEVPGPLARVLFELVDTGVIELVEYGDAGAVGLQEVPPHDRIDTQANTIRFIP